MINIHEKHFIESIPYEQVNPSHKRSTDFKNIHDIENKLTSFQIYHEQNLHVITKHNTEKYLSNTKKVSTSPLENQNLTLMQQVTINEGTPYVPVNLSKNAGNPGGELKPYDGKSTRLQELSLMNITYCGAIHYDFHLDMKLDYTISRNFQEMSISELETLHQLCELERTQILQSLALAVLKIPYTGYLLSGNR